MLRRQWETASMLIVANHLSDRPNDKLELLASLDAAAANGFTVSEVLATHRILQRSQCRGVAKAAVSSLTLR